MRRPISYISWIDDDLNGTYWVDTTAATTTSSWITNFSSVPTITINSIYPTIREIEDDSPRKPAPLEFNAYINASDRLEEFIRYLGTRGVRQSEVMKLPLGLFINWLIIEAAKFDGEQDIPEQKQLTVDLKTVGRCRYCKRFISRWNIANGIEYCSPEHLGKYVARASRPSL